MNIEMLRKGLRASHHSRAILFAVWLYHEKVVLLRISGGERISVCVERSFSDEELMSLYARWILEKSDDD